MQNPPAKKPAAVNPETTAAKKRLEALLQTLYGFYHTEIGMDLTRLPRLLHKMGNPHLKLPPVVHVAGTNGKGSTIATLRALLETSGRTVHVATSPHLVRANERIRLAGALISDAALADLLQETLAINDGEPITFFEIFMAATFLIFSRVPADFTLLETGLGGRLDATNLVPDPVCTVITTISKDHSEFLGDSLQQIAGEKAGIMKAGVPCVIGRQTQDGIDAGVHKVFQSMSTALSPAAPLLRYGAEWSSAPESGRMLFRFGDAEIRLPAPGLQGTHQFYNAGAALAAFRVIAPDCTDADFLSTALGRVEWDGRLQTLTQTSLNALVPADWDIVIDGGHNDSAGEALAQQAREWQDKDGRPLHLIVGMVRRKNPVEFLAPLAPYAATLTAVPIEGEASAFAPDDLKDRVKDLTFPALSAAGSVADALRALPRDGRPARVLITGSLYLVGSILAAA